MKNITSKRQLFLDFGRDYDASLSNFFFSKADQVLKNEILAVLQFQKKKDLFITGGNSSGKTFLLNSILNDAEISKKTIYVDLSKLTQNQNYFKDFETFDLICLDNIDLMHANLEIQLFNLINDSRTSEASLILASSQPLNLIKVFPDLFSRLKEINFFKLNPIDGDEANECLAFLAPKIGLHIEHDALDLISKKIRRDFKSIKKALIEFDKFLYSEKKQPTKMSAASFLKNYLS